MIITFPKSLAPGSLFRALRRPQRGGCPKGKGGALGRGSATHDHGHVRDGDPVRLAMTCVGHWVGRAGRGVRLTQRLPEHGHEQQ